MQVSITTVLASLIIIIIVSSYLTIYSLNDLLMTLERPYSKEGLNRTFRDSLILIFASTAVFLALAAIVFLLNSKKNP